MGNGIDVLFWDAWTWLIFVGVGLLLVLLELLFGVNTGLDLVFVGTAFILGGLITFVFRSWIPPVIVSGVICVAYIFIGRKYFHRRIVPPSVKTNIDAIVGQTGVVTSLLDSPDRALVKVGNETWQAKSEEPLEEGDPVTVLGISGVTLHVSKEERSIPS